MNISQLTAAEENLMQILWQLNSFYMRDVMEQHPEPKPHQNTVSTYLKILIEKGFLTAVREGRIFNYTVAVPLDVYKKHLFNDLVQKFYPNSAKEILQILFDEKLITQEDLTGYFDFKIQVKPVIQEAPVFEIAEEILNETPPKNKKKEKKDSKKKKKKKK